MRDAFRSGCLQASSQQKECDNRKDIKDDLGDEVGFVPCTRTAKSPRHGSQERSESQCPSVHIRPIGYRSNPAKERPRERCPDATEDQDEPEGLDRLTGKHHPDEPEPWRSKQKGEDHSGPDRHLPGMKEGSARFAEEVRGGYKRCDDADAEKNLRGRRLIDRDMVGFGARNVRP